MIYCLNGTLLSKTPNCAVLLCGGVGFSVFIPTSVYADLPETGGEAFLYTSFVVKEDAMELYGFSSQTQRDTFRLLTCVSGVGPKVALSILSIYDANRIALMIAAGDFKAFTACSGVGPKLAQRLVLELKDKIKDLGDFDSYAVSETAAVGGASGDAVAALTSLGFSQSEAASAVSKLPAGMSAEEMISAALKSLASR